EVEDRPATRRGRGDSNPLPTGKSPCLHLLLGVEQSTLLQGSLVILEPGLADDAEARIARARKQQLSISGRHLGKRVLDENPFLSPAAIPLRIHLDLGRLVAPEARPGHLDRRHASPLPST